MGCCNCKDPMSLSIFLINNEAHNKNVHEDAKLMLAKSQNLNKSIQSNNLRVSRQEKLMQRIYSYNTARLYDYNLNEELNKSSKNNTKTKIFERILSNMLSKNFSFDINIHKLSNIRRINSHSEIIFKSKNLYRDIACDFNYEKDNREILSAAKVNEYESFKFANTSKTQNVFAQKNKNKFCQTKTNEHNKTQDTKDFCRKTRHSECISTLNNTEQNTVQGQIDKINRVFTNSKFSEIKLNRTRTNDTLMDKIKGKVNAKSALSNKIREPEESKKIEEKIEFQNTMTITEDNKEPSLINYEEFRNIDNPIKSDEEEEEEVEHVSVNDKNVRSNDPSNLNSDLRISLNVLKFNSTDDLYKSNNYKLNTSNENNEQNNLVNKKFIQSIDNLLNKSNDKQDESEKAKNKTHEKNLITASNKKRNKISLIENINPSNSKTKSINYNTTVDKSLKLTNSNKKKNENKQFDITPIVLNFNSNLNSLNKSSLNNNNNKSSLHMPTQESQISTTENYGTKVTNFNPNANSSNLNSNKTVNKLEKKINAANHTNNNLNSNKKSKTDSLMNSDCININLNKSNKKSLQMIDLSDKKEFLSYKKSSEVFLNNSKLSNDKETNLNRYKKNIIDKNKNMSVGNYEENYNSIINEHYFVENTESEYLTYNKSISSEIDIKALTNRQSTVNNKKLNDSLMHEKIKKSNSKNKMNVIRLPKKPLNKNKNLKIVINPIYEFQNKNNLGAAASRKNENIISTPVNNSNKVTENPEKNKKEELIRESIIGDFNENNVDNINPSTTTNARKKLNLAVYDFSNEESLLAKKNKSHTPNNRGDNPNNNNEVNSNIAYSDKNKAGFNFKKFNYVFGDGNSTTNINKTSFFKSQTDLSKKTDQNTNNSNTQSNTNTYTYNNYDHKASEKSILSTQQTTASKEMSNLIKKVQFDGDMTNLKGRLKKK